MHCPNCGKKTEAEQKFCRSCGLQLEKVAELLAAQLPALAPDESLKARKRRVELLLTLLVGGMISILLLVIVWKIITQLMIEKGQVLGGAIFLAVILAGIIALALVFYRESLLEKETRRTPSAPPKLPGVDEKALPGPSFEPASSITDRTTELLAAKRRRDTREV